MSEKLTEREAEIVFALADNDINVSRASRSSFMHRNTIQYYIDKIYFKTGLNPKNFYDLCKLVQKAREDYEG